MLKTIFMGTPPLVMPAVRALYKNSNLSLIVTGKDKPFGRGRKDFIIPEPKQFAIENNIEYLQIDNVKDGVLLKKMESIRPDMAVVFAFGFILPENVFMLPEHGTVNIHTSLLPKYRGASPIHQALLHQDKITGVTIQKITEKLDCGDILFTKSVEILENDDYLTLEARLSALSGEALIEFLEKYQRGEIIPRSQYDEEASYCKKILKEHGEFHWSENKEEIVAKVKAYREWPVAYIKTRFGNLRVYKAGILDKPCDAAPGTVMSADKTGFCVACSNGAVCLYEIQPENKKQMDYMSFLNGHRIKSGETL